MAPPTPSLRIPSITRRTVLGTAVGAALGVSGVRLLVVDSPLSDAGRTGWPSPLGSERGRIAQLLRRAAFAVTPESLDRALHDGFAKTVDRLVETAPALPPPLISPEDPTRGAMLGPDDLQQWWVRHILTTPTPFAERMTYFWHGHFTSDFDKVGSPFMYWQNLTWRQMALGRLPSMLRDVTADPAMLLYLDLASSDASDPTQPPNENYARELMELFTMGPGNYTEGDVRAGARALAGWTTPPADREVEVVVDPTDGTTATVDVWDQQAPGYLDPDRAFEGPVTFLGRTGSLQLDDVIEQILVQPATARFLARKAATHFVSAHPDDSTVSQIADAFRTSGYDVRALMRATFTSPEFDAAGSYRSLVKSPLELMVSAALAVGAPTADSAALIAASGGPAGQALFQPPNVAGWPPNAAWISPGTLLARFNFVSQLLDGLAAGAPLARDAEQLHLDGILSDATAHRLKQAGSDQERWLVMLTAPEFNLK